LRRRSDYTVSRIPSGLRDSMQSRVQHDRMVCGE
jgi:hypothetical protein